MDWRRLRIMPFGKRGSRCCCVAGNPCFGCSGDIGNNMQVVLSGTADCGTCSNCPTLDGTYVVPYTGNCVFYDCFAVPSPVPTNGFYATNGFEIQVAIFFLFGTYYVDVNVGQHTSSVCPGSAFAGATFRYTTVTEPSCSFSGLVVPHFGSTTSSPCDFTSATCTLTVV
jgi:hypothetical protein